MDRQRGRYSQQAAIQELNRRGLWGYVEPILTLGSAAFAEPVSGMMGLAALPYGADAATRAINRTQEALTYQPRTIEGQETLQAAGEFLQPVGDAFIGASEYLGDAAYDATGSPALGAAAYSVPTMALEALGLKGASKLSRGRAYEFGDISDYTKGLGGKQRGIFAGVKAKGADLDAMEAAKELQRRGLSRDEIWQKTGWFEDVDGAWKWEIDDSQAGFIGKARLNELAEKDPYGVVDLSSKDAIPHAELLKNYPDERQLVSYDKNSTDYYGASYDPKTREIVLGAGLDGAEMKQVALHETQHAIQDVEGFAKGGSPDNLWVDDAIMDAKITTDELSNANMLAAMSGGNSKVLTSDADLNLARFERIKGRAASDNEKWLAKTFSPEYIIDQRQKMRVIDLAKRDKDFALARFKAGEISADEFYEMSEIHPKKIQQQMYKRLAGEAEARNVETRLDFTPEQRRATPPWQTLDVPEDELIVRK